MSFRLAFPRDKALRLCAVGAALLLWGCNGAGDAAVTIRIIGEPASLFETGARMPVGAQLIRAATAEGLVSFDAQGRIIPALADRWIVTDDGASYIFRLRDGTWPDGTPLTGESAEQSLRQAIADLRGTPLALDLGGIADIRAMAGRVVEIRLSQPVPDFLQLLAQPELGLLRKGRGAGPMALDREGRTVMLLPIPPEKRGLPLIAGWRDKVRPLQVRATPAAAAVDSFDQGEVDIVLGGRIEHFPLASRTGLTRAALRMDAVFGLFGLLVVRDQGFLGSAGNREALAMAIDRDGLLARFGLSGWVATTRIVSPGITGDSGTVAERWTELSLAQRRDEAALRVRRWRDGKQGAAVELRVALPDGPGADILFKRLSDDFAAIGVTMLPVKGAAQADLRLVDTAARYPRAHWFLNQLSCSSLRGPCSPQADRLVAQARVTTEAAGRAQLIDEAEAQLAADNIFLPFGAPVRWSLVGGKASGFSINRWGLHPLMPMAMRTK